MDIDNFSEEERNEIIRYGLQSIKSTFTMIIVLSFIGCIFHVFVQSIIFLICFMSLRKYAGGYHADTQGRCYVISTLIFVTACGVMRYVQMDHDIFLVLQTLNLLLLFLLVPVDNKNRRLEQWEKEKYGRRARIRVIVAYILYILLFINDFYSIATAIGMANLMVGGCVLAGSKINYMDRQRSSCRC